MACPPDDPQPLARDEIFQTSAPGEFRFDEAVAKVFPDMLRRSIPGYSTLLQLISVLSSEVVKSGTAVYDLGCSLGAVSLAIRHAVGARDTTIVAVDNSPAMVKRCAEIMDADSGLCPVQVLEGDISKLSLAPCSLVVMNFTLQFLPIDERPTILRRIADALVPGGALVISEKTQSQGAATAHFFTEMHDAFRSQNGYSQLEMSRKREALDKVLVPEAPEKYVAWMEQAGLVPVEWFRALQFVSWVGMKAP
jgi:tRNA (cmo5U34)-methyltransferase